MEREELEAIAQSQPYFAAIGVSVAEAQEMLSRIKFRCIPDFRLQETVLKLNKIAEEERWRTDPLGLMRLFRGVSIASLFREIADGLYAIADALEGFR